MESDLSQMDEHTIRVSYAILGMLGLVVAFLLGIATITWRAASTLQQMEDKISEMQNEQQQEKADMSAVKALLWAPVVAPKRH